MMGHTPGPWTYEYENGSSGQWYEISPRLSFGWDQEHGEQEANARLMAAAPELLEALEKLYSETVDALTMFGNPESDKLEDEQVMKFARAAIAKATGEAA